MAQLSSSKVYGDLYVTGDSTVEGSLNSPEFIGKLIGNADSATKLQTARTIAGVPFNGTANIAIPFANLSNIPSFAPSGHDHTVSQITNLGNIATINKNNSTANFLRGDGTWVTPPDTNTTYGIVTTKANGLMIAADKSKLDAIPADATNLKLGETSTTAYRGDYGKAAYTHMSDAVKHITEAERTNWNGKETPAGAQTKATKALTDAKAYVDGTADGLLSNYLGFEIDEDMNLVMSTPDNYNGPEFLLENGELKVII